MDMAQDVHPQYDLYQLFLDPSDTGHGGAARPRTYVIASRIGKTSCKQDPFDLLEAVRRVTRRTQTVPGDYCLADTFEVNLEAMHVANQRNLEWSPGGENEELDLRSLLLKREQDALNYYEDMYLARFQRPAAMDRNLMVYLGDNPWSRPCWSACSGAIPTLRVGSRSGKMWIPALRRWLVSREKLAAMGWPITRQAAQAMMCPEVPVRDIMRSAQLAGAAMHFNTVALAQMLALSCFGPLDL